ncbi:MAG: bifunctional riboflavin kinase/FAD synthetase [Hahellaceae bacterium]|nr:bifunctional riboflavin kinase/FAD synthetase [Hahellaceae bacterium]MCP5210628.1 bifunctional riboflavin kinase/FAD synthetase [Hahellaceae bacterium]
MRLIRGLHNLSSLKSGCVATIGNFDGVHQGHRVILAQVREQAKRLQVPSVVMVFEPQPREFFQHEQSPPRLMRFREKLIALQNEQIDIVVCLQFKARLRNLTADEFIQQILVDALKVRYLVVGDDFRFGCDRAGNFQLLQQSGERAGYQVERTRTVEVSGDRVSSTRIRQALDQNDFDLAAQLLGHEYTITGCVVHGKKLGRQFGVPTANVSLGRKKPALNGVYAVSAQLIGPKRGAGSQSGALAAAVIVPEVESWKGVANIGSRPTVDGLRPALEVHLLDFSGDLYGYHLRVVFHHKIRDEQKFASLDLLKQQILLDVQMARRYFDEGATPLC